MPPVTADSLPQPRERPSALARLRGITQLLDPVACVNIVRAFTATRSRLYRLTGVPLPPVLQIAVGLRCWAQREDTRRLQEAQVAAESPDTTEDVRTQRGSGSGRKLESGSGNQHIVKEVQVETVVLEEGYTNKKRRIVVDLTLDSDDEGEGASIASEGPSDTVNPHTDHHLPSYTSEELREAQFCSDASNDVYLRKVRHLCLVSAAAYAYSTEQVHSEYLPTLDPEKVIHSKWTAEKYSPAYFIYYDTALNAIVCSIRGTRDIPDMITNLTVDTTPFSPNYCLDDSWGYGHAGVIRSAKNLHRVLEPVLQKCVGPTYNRPSCIPSAYADKKIILTGHSLGGACASVLSLILSPRIFGNTETVVFGAPPCVSENVALHDRATNITMIMYGLDMVPRLSIGSFERLLEKVVRYDWRSHAGANAEAFLRSYWTSSNENGQISESQSRLLRIVGGAVRNFGVDSVVWAAEGVRNVAVRSLSVDAAPGARTASAAAWGVARAATAFCAGLISSQLRRTEATSNGFVWNIRSGTGYARAFGIDEEVVENELRARRGVKDLAVLGRILRMERDLLTKDVRRIEEVHWRELKDVEASLTMVYDHQPERIVQAVGELLGEAAARGERQ